MPLSEIDFVKSDPNVTSLQNQLTSKMGLNVLIKNSKKNSGKIVLEYKDLEQLNKIIDILKRYY